MTVASFPPGRWDRTRLTGRLAELFPWAAAHPLGRRQPPSVPLISAQSLPTELSPLLIERPCGFSYGTACPTGLQSRQSDFLHPRQTPAAPRSLWEEGRQQ